MKVELSYPEQVTRKGRFITIIILLTLNMVLVIVKNITTVIVLLVGALASPIEIFVLPGYLFYD